MTADDSTIKFYNENADQYRARFAKNEPNAALAAFIDMLPAGAHVLDLGCGPGNSAAMMNAAGLTAEGWDASEEMVAVARETFGVEARCARFSDLDADGFYDGIWANFSLLHAPREEMAGHIAAIHRALKPGGVFHIGLKTGTGKARDQLERLYTFYTVAELEGLLTGAGFRIAAQREGVSRGMAGTEDPFVIMLAHA
ncbi:MAG: class I SAM-dependent methyltransferase [Pseudomonadota bacterium]